MSSKHPDKRGPSSSWTDHDYDLVVTPFKESELRRAVTNLASACIDAKDCALLLDMLGINIKEVIGD